MCRFQINSLEPFFNENHFWKVKCGLSNLSFHRFSIVNNYDIRKDNWKGIVTWHLKKIFPAIFSRHELLQFKIGLPNLDFHQVFCRKWLMHSKKNVKRCFYIEFEENSENRFWDTHFLFNFRLALPHFRFFDFRQNLEILCVHLTGAEYKISLLSLLVLEI